jgi:cytochrome c553
MSRHALAAALLLALGAFACGADEQEALRRYGRHLAQECASCHRSDESSGAIPSLGGRPQAEIVALLEDFREGRKTNPVMVSVAKSLDQRQSAALATYFASLPKSTTPTGAIAR